MSVNKVILLGNVGKDPEIKTMSNGNEVANFSLATTDVWKDKQTGEKKDKTEWHRIVVFSPGLVNVIKNYVKKGSKLYIEGSLQTRKWTDNNNNDKFVTEIVLQGYGCSLQMLDGRDSGSSGSSSSSSSYAGSDSAGSVGSADSKESQGFVEEIDDDIPF